MPRQKKRVGPPVIRVWERRSDPPQEGYWVARRFRRDIPFHFADLSRIREEVPFKMAADAWMFDFDRMVDGEQPKCTFWHDLTWELCRVGREKDMAPTILMECKQAIKNGLNKQELIRLGDEASDYLFLLEDLLISKDEDVVDSRDNENHLADETPRQHTLMELRRAARGLLPISRNDILVGSRDNENHLEDDADGPPDTFNYQDKSVKLTPTSQPAPRNAMCLEGETWKITFGEEQGTVRNMKGARYVAMLFQMHRDTSTVQISASQLHGGTEVDLKMNDPVLTQHDNAQQIEEYKEELFEIEQRIDKKSASDQDYEDREAIVDELKRLTGPVGQPRQGEKAGSARVAVSQAIQRFIKRCREAGLTGFADHLDRFVDTGSVVTYRQEGKSQWEIDWNGTRGS